MGTKEKARAFADRRIQEFKNENPELASAFSGDFENSLRSFYLLGFADGHSEFVDETRSAICTEDVCEKSDYVSILESASNKPTDRMCGEYPADNQF